MELTKDTVLHRVRRFEDCEWINNIELVNCFVGGLGNIGSWLSLFLSRIGPNLEICDFDKVEPHNIGGQLYNLDCVDELKVHGIFNILKEFSGFSLKKIYITPVDSTFNFNTDNIENYYFSCFDNMKARSDMFNRLVELSKHTDNLMFFIDGRSNIESFQAYFVDLRDEEAVKKYRETLFSDDDVPDSPCGFKSTTHCGAQLATIMTSLFTNNRYNVESNFKIRETPFKTEVSLQNFSYDFR